MRAELVKWLDAGTSEEDLTWAAHGKEADGDDIIISSIGWVVKETDKYLTIAMDLSNDNETHTRSRIPMAMIISREVLKT